jgi:hypothetical protein
MVAFLKGCSFALLPLIEILFKVGANTQHLAKRKEKYR